MRPAEIARFAAAWLLLCLPATVAGLSADRTQPIYIEADSAVLKEKEGISTYTGNVTLRQGSLSLRGEAMTVYHDGDHIKRVILTGNPATIVQRPEGRDMDLHAESRRMEYLAADEQIILSEDARIWQEDGKEFRSDRIIYNITTNTVNAGGDADGDRVHITFQPKQKKPQDTEADSE
jgi:lipopolysaccharide export system protein LptA